ncbi:hypothetical protein [Denitrobaculum tricleocarpae]|uniref:Uncharacterized protein n=1 Tax=Denitrobaculum tricleocarpae TaxID=2591009 RepID=A0A545TKY7_9PROT|nr:hypothetical protein [Denitrobaculum tricleocarpae]TQV77867.1 hypothetical protein FKG95_20165 [Denitrobaculum tricleocarpae]
MNTGDLREIFGLYLDKFWKLDDVSPFTLVYIRLLLLFKDELSQMEVNVILERRKQLLGEKFNNQNFDEMSELSRKEMDRTSANNTSMTRAAMLNRLVFCALLDRGENDFFYLTEPMFEFADVMRVSPEQIQEMLELEFDGFTGPSPKVTR